MAGGTVARVVLRGHVFKMAGGAFADADVVELEWLPIVGEVAVGAFALEMFGWWWLMTTAALGGCTREFAFGVAAFAVETAVPATEGEETVVYVFTQKGDDLAVNGRYLSPIRNQ